MSKPNKIIATSCQGDFIYFVDSTCKIWRVNKEKLEEVRTGDDGSCVVPMPQLGKSVGAIYIDEVILKNTKVPSKKE